MYLFNDFHQDGPEDFMLYELNDDFPVYAAKAIQEVLHKYGGSPYRFGFYENTAKKQLSLNDVLTKLSNQYPGIADEFEAIRQSENPQEGEEEKAEACHKIWSHWMQYQFQCGTLNADGSFTIPKEKVDRWKELSQTQFDELSFRDTLSDFKVAKQFLSQFKLISKGK